MKRLLTGMLLVVLLLGSLQTETGGETIPTENPLPTAGPVLTEIPAPTEVPLPTEAPVPTEAPLPTEAPAPTEVPLPTEAPVPTEVPLPTEAPLPTEIPLPTEAPLPTEGPVPTEVPLPTEAPLPTEEPQPTEIPVLQALYVSSSDTYGKGILKLDPQLSVEHDKYQAVYEGERKSLNLWPEAAGECEIHVYALSGVKASTVEKDESIKDHDDRMGHRYWKLVFADNERKLEVRIQVTASDGMKKDYYLTLSTMDTTPPVLKKISASRISTDTASVVYKTSEKGYRYYQVTQAGAALPKLDTSQKGTQVGEGTDTIALTGLTAGEKDLVIAVKDLAGNISEQLVIRIPDIKAATSGSLASRPGYGGNKSQATKPGSGGDGSIDKLKNVQGTAGSLKNPSGAAGSAGAMGSAQLATGKKKSQIKDKETAKKKNKDKKKETAKEQTKSSEKDKAENIKSSFSQDTGDKSQAPDTKDLQKNSSSGKKSIFSAFKGLRLSTKLMLAGAVAGLAYILLFTAAKRHYKRMYKRTDRRIRA